MEAIVCISENWGIGIDGRLLFQLSADKKRFRTLTVGKTVLLGSRTLATFPEGKPLPDRRCIVFTRNTEPIEGAEVAHTVEDALRLAGDDAIVIGGASIYTLLLPYCERVRVTKVFASPKADSFFPNLDTHPDWRVDSKSEIMEEDGLKFQFIDYVKK
ncbi:MAG: dihydrofolate reductase [Ruminococcaceae bacterium]|jgi:dihydrofolate reductase|nr:dihydrofolate reductase [Oscillospiraceae bacterium]